MGGPMEGIKVVEMGVWVAGPSCAAILADWGADVVKIEPPTGDPFRGLFASALGAPIPINPPFEIDNRGKRSVCLNLENEQGLRHRQRAASMRRRVRDEHAAARARTVRRLLRRRPQDATRASSTASVTGQGPDTPDANRASYDVGGFWSRAGVGVSLTAAGQPIPQQRGGMGDHMTGVGGRRRDLRRAVLARAHGRGPARRRIARAHRRVHDGLGLRARDANRRQDQRPTIASTRRTRSSTASRRRTSAGSGCCCCRATATGPT